jgi:hypothetical protein
VKRCPRCRKLRTVFVRCDDIRACLRCFVILQEMTERNTRDELARAQRGVAVT